jgi:site-specific DNA-methyltransferase (adenine-specific)
MSRVEIIGDATLYLGDCREVLPTLPRVDAVVTDPPYGIDGGRGGDSREFQKGAYAAAWSDTEDYIKDVCAPIVADALAKAERGAITPGIRCLHFYKRPDDIGCFWTPASLTHGPWGFTNFQPILYYGRDFRAGLGSLPTGRALTEAAEKNGHPCPKPLLAWTWLLNKVSQDGETILDPFMGSGTTGVACIKLGRKFIGIEIEPKYFDIACRRIEAAWAQPRLFDEPQQKPEQTRMVFDENA